MLFARWQHHLRFCSGFPYAPLKTIITKISKWSIQDSFRITPKIESLVVCAIPDIPSKFQKNPSITFWVILHTHTHTHTHTHRQTDTKQSLAKTNLLGGGNKKHVMSVTPVLARPILSSCVCFNLTAWLRDCQCNFYCIVGVTSNVPLAWMKFETTTFSDLECNIIRKLLISLLVHMTSKIIMTAAYFYVKYLVICEFNASLP